MASKKYIRGGNENKVYTGEKVKENTELDTLSGKVVVSAGNYVFTEESGDKFGVSAQEIGTLYTEVASTKAKSEEDK